MTQRPLRRTLLQRWPSIITAVRTRSMTRSRSRSRKDQLGWDRQLS